MMSINGLFGTVTGSLSYRRAEVESRNCIIWRKILAKPPTSQRLIPGVSRKCKRSTTPGVPNRPNPLLKIPRVRRRQRTHQRKRQSDRSPLKPNKTGAGISRGKCYQRSHRRRFWQILMPRCGQPASEFGAECGGACLVLKPQSHWLESRSHWLASSVD